MRIRRRTTMWEILVFANIVNSKSYVPPESVSLTNPGDNPEQALLKKEIYTNLSKEAKDVVKLIYNCPSEIIELVDSPTVVNALRKRLLKKLKSNFSGLKTVKILEELKYFAGQDGKLFL